MRPAQTAAAAFLLALGCSRTPQAEPVETKPFQKRFVRVHLRSLGDWKQLEIRGKGGLWVGDEKRDSFLLRREQTGTIVMRGDQGIVTIGNRAYAGDLLWRKGKLINNLSLENYVLGVLRGELPLKQVPLAAAGAQAIAVRSYTLHYVRRHGKVFDVDDTTQFQVYAGLKYAPDDDSLRAGVQATTGMYLEYLGEPLKAYYHSTCGGHTTDVPTGLDREAVPPMSGVPCDFCRISKYWRWTATLPYTRIEVAQKGPGGRARSLRVDGRIVKASKFRLEVGPSRLRSTLILGWRPSSDGKSGELSGAGWGHGVGLCQMGAIGRARKKWSAHEIASYYYPGAAIRRVP